MNLRNKPEFTYETIKRMEDMTWFTHCLIFDDLLIVAQKETNCFVWKTSEGLVVIDGIWPDKAVYDAIVDAINDVGWNTDDICKYVITHGHVDHTGCGKWLVTNHNVTTYLSKIDDQYWEEFPTKPDRPDTWKDFNIDKYIQESDIIDCGDKQLYVVNTPGHTPGCLSFIFPVKDNGVEHIAALFGGATPPRNDADGVELYKESIKHFENIAISKNADVALSNHTIFDQGLDRIQYSQNRYSYMPNIYVLGQIGFSKFMEIYKTLA